MQSGEAVSERDSGNEMSNATGRTSAAQVRSASAPRQSFGFDYRMYHDDADLASDKDSRDKRAEARAKARETAANLVATRDAPARHQGREIVAATFAALDGVAPNNIRSPTTEATEVTAMLAKKKQKLLDKVDGGRATHKVMGSATVAALAINSAPKLSDFDSVAEHAEEMRKWIAKNLPKKAIEKDTRVRTRVDKTLACEERHVRTTLARYYELGVRRQTAS